MRQVAMRFLPRTLAVRVECETDMRDTLDLAGQDLENTQSWAENGEFKMAFRISAWISLGKMNPLT